jgi:DNA adenine methylase
MGSKKRISKDILPIILRDRKLGQWYVEPFVGGGNMIENVDGNRIGADVSEDVIAALCLIRDNPKSLPKNNKEFTEDDYKKVKNKEVVVSKGFYGYCAFALSYGGKFWGGWSRDGKNKRDYVNEAYKNAMEQSLKLQKCILCVSSYDKLVIPRESIIYCDIPYNNSTKYKTSFDHHCFWDWCREKVKEKNKVFISEYDAPNDFECIWKKDICSSLTTETGSKKATEKLFIWKGQK